MKAWWLCALLLGGRADAQALRLPPPPAVRFAPAAGARLPLGLTFADDNGASVRLGALFGASPVVLVPGYYTCPNLCSTLFEGVLQALAISGLPPGAYRLVGLSVDPRDTPARAAARKRAYAGLLPTGGRDLHLLTGRADALAAVIAALGYRALPGPDGELAHAAGFVVATADGRVARYFPGVRFDPAQLRGALLAAREGRTQGIVERLLLLCAHYDPAIGRHTDAALAAVRAGVLALLAALCALGWRRLRKGRP